MKAALLVAALALAALGCSKRMDPTTLLSVQPSPTPAPTGPGVRIHITRAGDGIPAVMNVWVEDLSSTACVKTLLTYNPTATYDCPLPSNCPIEFAWWPLYWPLSNNGALTDGNTSATVAYSANTSLDLFWDWKDRSATVLNGAWTIRAEVAGYNYAGANGEAHVGVLHNAAAGSATGSVDTGSQFVSISADWQP